MKNFPSLEIYFFFKCGWTILIWILNYGMFTINDTPNNAVEGWNCKVNRLMGRMKPNVYFLTKILKDEEKMVSHLVNVKELGNPPENRRKKYVKLVLRL